MQYGDPAVRAAYVAGVRDATDAIVIELPALQVRELESWLRELDE
jgi:hypothetical protein